MAFDSLTDVLRELAAHGGDDIKSDVVSYRVTIPASGDITQPSAEQLRSNYDYYVVGVRGSMTGTGGGTDTADADADDIQEIRFNLKESGSGQNLFTSDIEWALLSDSWSGQPVKDLTWGDGKYGIKLRAGAHLQATFTRRASTITTARVCVLAIMCVLIPKNFHLRPPKPF